METKKNSQIARLLALLALAGTALILVIAIGGAIGGDDDGGDGKKATNQHRQQTNRPRTKKKTYEVKEGDTLTGIAQKTGIPIARIEALNPDLDPQALTLGQKLKLR